MISFAKSQVIEVVDANTKSGVDYVYIYNRSGSVLTDVKGKANVTDLLITDSVIQIQHPGYNLTFISKSELQSFGHRVLLTPTVLNVEEIVVAASKWKQNVREVSKKVILMSKDEVTFMNTPTTADLLGSSNDVFIQKSQLGGGSPMLRGFSTSRVLLVIDGVRMNNAIFREGNVQNVISLDPNAVQNTEVVFGPGASIYGSDALGGVMSFTTLEPNFSIEKPGLTSFNTFMRYGSAANELTGHIDFNFGDDRWASRTSITFSEFGDLRMGANGPDEYLRNEYQKTERGIDQTVTNSNPLIQVGSGYNQLNIMEKLAFKATPFTRLDLGLHYSTTSDVPRYDRLIQYNGDHLKYARWAYGPQVWGMVNFSLLHSKSHQWFDNVKWNVTYQNFEESRISRRFNSDNQRTQKEGVQALSTNLDFEKKISPETGLVYGLEGVYNGVSSQAFEEDVFTGEQTDAATRYPDGSIWASGAVYFNLKHRFSSRLITDVGLRYSYVYSYATFSDAFYDFSFTESVNNNGALNGVIGLSYLPNELSKLYFHVSSGFRAPNIDDIGKVFDSEPGAVIVPNTELQPEYLYTTEIGWVQQFAENYAFEVSGFYSWLQNAMIRAPYTLNGMDTILYEGEESQVLALQNVDEAFVYGGQIGIQGDVSKHFNFKANINYTFGETSDGEPLRHVAPLFGQVGIGFTHGWFKANFNWVYNGEVTSDRLAPSERSKDHIYLKNSNGELYSPSWSTLNLRISLKLNHYLEALGGIENILDTRYRPYSSGIAAAGRNFYITLRAYL